MSKARFYPGHEIGLGEFFQKSVVLSYRGIRVTGDAPPAAAFMPPFFTFK